MWEKTEHLLHAEAAQESELLAAGVFGVEQNDRRPSARAGEEAKGMDQYDYILVNDDVEECVDHLHDIIVSEHSRASRNIDFIEDIQRQTEAFQK